jgi:dual oxidase
MAAVALTCALSAPSVLAAEVEYPSFDGFYHNQHFPDWGTLDTPFLRLGGGALYNDATYRPLSEGRPSPRLLSEQLFDQPPSSRPLSSLRNATALMVFFGQQLFAEIHNGLLPGCPVEYFNIPVPRCDKHFDAQCTGKAEIPFQRSRYVATSGQGPSVPRAQLNQNSAWIDGGSIYGDTKTWTDQLRSRSGGRLKARDAGGRFPALNKAGLPFVNVPPPTDNPGPGIIRHPKTRNVNGFMSQSRCRCPPRVTFGSSLSVPRRSLG